MAKKKKKYAIRDLRDALVLGHRYSGDAFEMLEAAIDELAEYRKGEVLRPSKSTSVGSDLVSASLKDPEIRRGVEYDWFIDTTILQIDRAMDKLSLSRTDLAKRLGCSPANVTQILRSGSNLTLKKLMDLALALGCRFLAPKLRPLSAPPPWSPQGEL